MFAVPGWTVSSSALKKQTVAPGLKDNTAKVQQSSSISAEEVNTGKKRKRSSGKSKKQDVNASNLADLWGSVIEGLEQPDSGKSKPEKRRKINAVDVCGDGDISDRSKPLEAGGRIEKKSLKEKKRDKKKKLAEDANSKAKGDDVVATIAKSTVIAQPRQPAATLTPLQASMRQKLISARFRHLNQQLYTTPSIQSLSLFQENPEMFQEYHEGFRRQVEVWPENPVDSYISQIKERSKIKGAARGREPNEASTNANILAPLPRTEGVCNIADLGCGDAGISSGLEVEKKKHKIKVFSYDLQSPSPLVTRADIANLPLADNSVDIAIFCLALMGTNWVDFVEEAFRILRWKGELWVAEIKSRFGRVVGKGGKKVVDHSVGNRKKQPNKKEMKKSEGEMDDAQLLVEVDGHDVPRETDVSAFVEVLRKRGFALRNENSVELDNKMFVKMTFVKGLTPIKGKCVPIPKGMEKMGMETWKKKSKAKFIDEDEIPVSSEASVLKPCVYKIR